MHDSNKLYCRLKLGSEWWYNNESIQDILLSWAYLEDESFHKGNFLMR